MCIKHKMAEDVLIIEVDSLVGGDQRFWVVLALRPEQNKRQTSVRSSEPRGQLDGPTKLVCRAGHIWLSAFAQRDRIVVVSQGILWTQCDGDAAPTYALTL